MTRYATELGASPGRGAYAETIEAARLERHLAHRRGRDGLQDAIHPQLACQCGDFPLQFQVDQTSNALLRTRSLESPLAFSRVSKTNC